MTFRRVFGALITAVKKPRSGLAAGCCSSAGAMLLLGACAATPGDSATRSRASDCFFASTLRDWRPLDDENLVLFANGRRPYHVELVMPAFGLTYDVMIGVYDRDGRICPYGGDSIIVDGALRERIPIRSVRRLTEPELYTLYDAFGIEQPAIVEATPIDPETVDEQTQN